MNIAPAPSSNTHIRHIVAATGDTTARTLLPARGEREGDENDMEQQQRGKSGTDRFMAIGWATLGATVAVGAAAVVATVRAQGEPPPVPAPRPGLGGQGGGFGGGGFPGGPGGFLGGGRVAGPPVAVAVGEGTVFVVRGNTLYKMNPQSLRVEGQTPLPEEPRARPLRNGVSPDDPNGPPPDAAPGARGGNRNLPNGAPPVPNR